MSEKENVTGDEFTRSGKCKLCGCSGNNFLHEDTFMCYDCHKIESVELMCPYCDFTKNYDLCELFPRITGDPMDCTVCEEQFILWHDQNFLIEKMPYEIE